MIRLEPHRHLLRGSGWSVAAVSVNALGGAGFWLLAAHVATPQSVGRATALFTSVLFVNYATAMGLPVALARFASDDSPESGSYMGWACLYTTVTALVGTVLFRFVVHPRAWSTLPAGLSGVLLFAALVAGSSLAILVDVRLLALRRWSLTFVRVATVSAVKLALLLMMNDRGPAPIFVVSAAVPAVSGVLGLTWLGRVGTKPWHLWPVPPRIAEALRYSSVNYLGMLLLQAPTFAVPVLVVVSVSPSSNAAFYIAWSVTTIVFLVPAAVGQVLLVEGGRTTSLKTQVRLVAAGMVVVMAVISVLGSLLAASFVDLYGSEYRSAAELLPRLLIAAAPWAITSACLAGVRVRHDTFATMAIAATLGCTIVGITAATVGSRGAIGAADGWLVGHLVTAVVSLAVLERSERLSTTPASDDDLDLSLIDAAPTTGEV